MKEYHVLNLGAGVQSTALAMMASDGLLLRPGSVEPVRFDCAVFADTGEEPSDPGESVSGHLEWLRGRLKFPVLVGSAGRLGDHLVRGKNSTGGRFASIPAFTLKPSGSVWMVRRQCTKEYKIEVVARTIRREFLGLAPRRWVPRDVVVNQYVGISLDEAGRMHKARKQQESRPTRWARFHYPLVEWMPMTRAECREWLKDRVPHRVPRSACVFCPFHSNEEWARIKARGGKDWERVVEIDRALRREGNVVNRKMDGRLFLHRSCVPIDQVDFSGPGDREMAGECLGMCGS